MTRETGDRLDRPGGERDDLERYGRYRVPRLGRDAVAEPGLGLHEEVRGSKPGSRYYRLTPSREQRLRRVAPGEFEATAAGSLPTGAVGRRLAGVRRLLLGRPLASEELPNQRLSKVKALAIYSSDQLSSVAYATEEILVILVLAGTGALKFSIPISAAIVTLTLVVVASYRQTIHAYPNGGGAYIVAKDNLGEAAGLIAGSALFVDYILTVAVSVAAGIFAVTSAAPALHHLRVELSVGCVALIALGNLRGIREAGTIFAIPTYFFIVMFVAMIGTGFVRLALGGDLTAPPPADARVGVESITIFLILRAFSSGCAAVTGIEAVANGVPNFKRPEAKNAATTQLWMGVILAFFFMGTSILAHRMDILPSESQSVVSQIARTVFGDNVLFYLLQAATALILVLAANTSFADLPMLSSVMARDDFMPRQLAFRGDRLSFSNGIFVLGISASALLIIFQADTNSLIPLYAFGVFTALTFSQGGMVVHWWRKREPGWRARLVMNAIGAVTTAVVALTILGTKFLSGAWLSLLTMGFLIFILWRVKRHYEVVAEDMDPGEPAETQPLGARAGRHQPVLIPVDDVSRAVLRTITYAQSISDNVRAVHVTDDPERGEALRRRWHQFVLDVPLDTVDSPWRSLVEPILNYIDALQRQYPGQMVTVVLPELVTRWPWQRLLHNQLSLRLKSALVHRPNTVLVDVPYHLRR